MKKNENIILVYYYIIVSILTIVAYLIKSDLLFLYLGLVSIAIGLFVQRIEKRLSNKIERSLSTLSQIDFLYEEEFYSKFKQMILQATISVDITHLGLTPPLQRKDSLQSDYYKNLYDVYKKSKATIRRVERVSVEKIEWIEGLLNKMEGLVNFSMFCLVDNEKELAEMSDYLSVQRVDEEHVFFVAVTEHRSTSKPRDIYIKSKRLGEYFLNYYETRLIRKSLQVMKDGKMVPDSWNKIKGLLN